MLAGMPYTALRDTSSRIPLSRKVSFPSFPPCPRRRQRPRNRSLLTNRTSGDWEAAFPALCLFLNHSLAAAILSHAASCSAIRSVRSVRLYTGSTFCGRRNAVRPHVRSVTHSDYENLQPPPVLGLAVIPVATTHADDSSGSMSDMVIPNNVVDLGPLIQSLPGQVTAPLPGQIVPPLPGQIVQSLPGQVVRALPGQVVGPLPNQLVRSLPNQIVQSLPGQMSGALPGQVIHLATTATSTFHFTKSKY